MNVKDITLESELKVLEVLWGEGDITASDLITKLKELAAWSDTTTLQVIRRCIAKGLVERSRAFTCRALVTKEELTAKQQKLKLGIPVDKMSDALSDFYLHHCKMEVG